MGDRGECGVTGTVLRGWMQVFIESLMCIFMCNFRCGRRRIAWNEIRVAKEICESFLIWRKKEEES